MVARAYRTVGDDDSADRELAAAARTFEVPRLVAAGKTNRAIAGELSSARRRWPVT